MVFRGTLTVCLGPGNRAFAHFRFGNHNLGMRETSLHFSQQPGCTLGERHKLQAKLLQHKAAFGSIGHARATPGVPVDHGCRQTRALPHIGHLFRQ